MPPTYRTRRTLPALTALTVLTVVCGSVAVAETPATRDAATLARFATLRERASIVPRVDHHQHLVGPTVLTPASEPLPEVELPAELAQVLRERNRLMGRTDIGDLYSDDAQILKIDDGGDWWVRGRSGIADMVRAYTTETRFVPNAYGLGDSAGWIAGVVRSGDSPGIELNFMLGLRRDPHGTWQISSEQATLIPPRAFAEPITADDLIHDLDVAGIERAVILSVAYWVDGPSSAWPDEYAAVQAENNWTAAQVARYPGRLVAICGINPLREYAVREVRRCATELNVRGVKMHLRSSRVDLLNAKHLEQVRAVFRAANELGLAIVMHAEQRDDYGPAHAEFFLSQLLPAAPAVTVQIAHLWGGNQYRPEVLAFWADAVAAGDPRTRNLYFDLTQVDTGAGDSGEALAEIAGQLRRIGMARILYGSDAQVTPGEPPAALSWAMLRQALPLTNEEWRTIAANEAPYLK